MTHSQKKVLKSIDYPLVLEFVIGFFVIVEQVDKALNNYEEQLFLGFFERAQAFVLQLEIVFIGRFKSVLRRFKRKLRTDHLGKTLENKWLHPRTLTGFS